MRHALLLIGYLAGMMLAPSPLVAQPAPPADAAPFDASVFAALREAIAAPYDPAELAELKTLMDKAAAWAQSHPDAWRQQIVAAADPLSALAKSSIWATPDEGARLKTLILRLQMAVSISQKQDEADHSLKQTAEILEHAATEIRETIKALTAFATKSSVAILQHQPELEAALQIYDTLINGAKTTP